MIQVIVQYTHLWIITCSRSNLYLLFFILLIIFCYIHWPQVHSNLIWVQSEKVYQILNCDELEHVIKTIEAFYMENCILGYLVFFPECILISRIKLSLLLVVLQTPQTSYLQGDAVYTWCKLQTHTIDAISSKCSKDTSIHTPSEQACMSFMIEWWLAQL